MITDLTARPETDHAPSGAGTFVSLRPAPPKTLEEALELLDVEFARRLQAEELLKETEARFRTFSERAGKFLWISDPDTGELVYVSPGHEEIWARKREGSYGTAEQWARSLLPSEPRTVTLGDPVSRDQLYQVAGDDGSVRWIRDRMFPIRDAAGNVQRILGIAEDITDTKQMHEIFTQSTARAKALIAIVPDMVFRVRRDGTILEFHPGKENPVALQSETLTGNNIKELLPATLATQAMEFVGELLHSREVRTASYQYPLTSELRDFEVRGIFCADDEALVLLRDVTERKRMEREIVEASHREQQRIGEDLHDGLGQHLTGITFLTKALERKLTTKLPEEAKEAAEIGRLVMQALAQTRNLARGLFPAELERNGLAAALTELTASVQKTCGVRCSLKTTEKISINDNVLATHVFRIAQEAINNSIKHSKAKNIEVTLDVNGDKLHLTVSDDGVGFSPEAKLDGLGMRIMQFRARRIGGELRVAPGPAGGTSVTCSFRNKYESN